jgi:hypothetical protein
MDNNKANKARLDNHWGCSSAMLSVVLTRHTVAAFTPTPAVPALERSAKKRQSLCNEDHGG